LKVQENSVEMLWVNQILKGICVNHEFEIGHPLPEERIDHLPVVLHDAFQAGDGACLYGGSEVVIPDSQYNDKKDNRHSDHAA